LRLQLDGENEKVRATMLQKSVLWLLILVMLVKTSVLPCAAMSGPQPMLLTATSVQLLTASSQHQHCADDAAIAGSEHLASTESTEQNETGNHFCYSCHSCGAAGAMMVAAKIRHANRFTEHSPQLMQPNPPLVWLALPERPPKPADQV
jgi:cytochrome c5